MMSRAALSTVRRLCGRGANTFGLTQADVARRLGISQSAYAQQEGSERLRKMTREKVAAALGIGAEQLDF